VATATIWKTLTTLLIIFPVIFIYK
jgi:hypothetical protein